MAKVNKTKAESKDMIIHSTKKSRNPNLKLTINVIERIINPKTLKYNPSTIKKVRDTLIIKEHGNIDAHKVRDTLIIKEHGNINAQKLMQAQKIIECINVDRHPSVKLEKTSDNKITQALSILNTAITSRSSFTLKELALIQMTCNEIIQEKIAIEKNETEENEAMLSKTITILGNYVDSGIKDNKIKTYCKKISTILINNHKMQKPETNLNPIEKTYQMLQEYKAKVAFINDDRLSTLFKQIIDYTEKQYPKRKNSITQNHQNTLIEYYAANMVTNIKQEKQ